MSATAFALSLAFPALLLWAAANDVARFEIPNVIPLALAAAFPIYGVAAAMPLAQIGWHFGVGILTLAAGAALFFSRVVGGGDAKLIAATAVWTGAAGLPRFLVAMALVGGLLAALLILYRLLPAPSWGAEEGWLRRLHARRREAPYAVAIGGGGLAWYFGGTLPGG